MGPRREDMAAPCVRRWWVGFGVLERRWERRTAAVDLVMRREAIPVYSDAGCGGRARQELVCLVLDEPE